MVLTPAIKEDTMDICEICGNLFPVSDDHINISGIAICDQCAPAPEPTEEETELGEWTSSLSGGQSFTVEPADDDYPFGTDYRKITLRNGVDYHDHIDNISAHITWGRWSRITASVAALALALLATPAAAQDLYPPETYTRGCYQMAETGEGFPVMACPEDGAMYYIDLDGSDGTLGTAGDGRWIALP
jgi:hypothetical protein